MPRCILTLATLALTASLAPALAHAAEPTRTAYILGGLADADTVAVAAAVAVGDPDAVVLPDTEPGRPSVRRFLDAWKPSRVVAVGSFEDGEKRFGPAIAPADAIAKLVPKADAAVIAPAEPYPLLLRAAALAGATRAPLLVARPGVDVAGWLGDRGAAKAIVVGEVAGVPERLAVTRLADIAAVDRAHRASLKDGGPCRVLVLANPADVTGDRGRESPFAAWVATRKRAALLLTNEAGSDANPLLTQALREPDLAAADHLLILATPKAIPPEKRPNPLAGKDEFIEMEPGTPVGGEPFTLATGRVFHADPAVALLMIERGRLLPPAGQPRKALVYSNPGGSLPLLETFSRQTTKELRNGGYSVVTRFEDEGNPEHLRRALPEQDIFVWEGHHKTLVEEFGLPKWPEPMRPSLVFLQSCLALNEPETRPLFDRGAYAVVGSSTRTYSGSGGAFTLAFFDAMIYDGQTVGGALRQAKNFLRCYSDLKDKRLGSDAKLTGANVRSSWAFTLWGDPTLRLPTPAANPDALAAVSRKVEADGHITLNMPGTRYDTVTRAPYTAELWPNARMAGLLTKETDEDKRLVPFLYAEVRLEIPVKGQRPKLHGKLPQNQYVFNWDERRRTGYLLALPRTKDKDELRFRVEWLSPELVPAPADGP